jgi:hypothetical protein
MASRMLKNPGHTDPPWHGGMPVCLAELCKRSSHDCLIGVAVEQLPAAFLAPEDVRRA